LLIKVGKDLNPKSLGEDSIFPCVHEQVDYLKGQRHEFVLYLSAWLRKEGIKIESVSKVVEGLAADDS
jgi:hypothetical protein